MVKNALIVRLRWEDNPSQMSVTLSPPSNSRNFEMNTMSVCIVVERARSHHLGYLLDYRRDPAQRPVFGGSSRGTWIPSRRPCRP